LLCPPIEIHSVLDQIEASLLSGTVLEACNFATDAGFWHLALILSTRIDQKAYASVVSAMLQKANHHNQEAPVLSSSLSVLLLVFGGAFATGRMSLNTYFYDL
jgi:hypothetical protein